MIGEKVEFKNKSNGISLGVIKDKIRVRATDVNIDYYVIVSKDNYIHVVHPHDLIKIYTD